MISPTRQLILGMLAGLPIALLAVFMTSLWVIWAAYVAGLILCAGLDLVLGLHPRQLTLDAQLSPMIYLGEPAQLTLNIQGRRWSRTTPLQVRFEVEGELDELETVNLRFDGMGKAATHVELKPLRRGELQVSRAYVRWPGPLSLFERTHEVELELKAQIIPNINAVRRAALRLATHHSFMSGTKQRRYIGDGSEFESLREYMPGLDIRGIDWRASARHRKILCRENRSERNHRVIIAFDTGHLMRASIDGMPRLDHAINAGLLLGYLSLKIGDQVGLYAFDSATRAYCEPAAGVKQLQRLQHAAAGLEYSSDETNFTLGVSELAQRLRRRAVIIVMTDFTDSVTAELMVENMQWMARRHLLIFVGIRDPALDQTALVHPDALLDVNRAVVAGDVLRERSLVFERLRRQGIFCIDAMPSQLSVELINRYLDIHRRELV